MDGMGKDARDEQVREGYRIKDRAPSGHCVSFVPQTDLLGSEDHPPYVRAYFESSA